MHRRRNCQGCGYFNAAKTAYHTDIAELIVRMERKSQTLDVARLPGEWRTPF
jgi:hypothetical protein